MNDQPTDNRANKHNDDVRYLRLRAHYILNRIWGLLEINPQQALVLLHEGRKIAQKLEDPCLILEYDQWITETYLFYLNLYADGLDTIVRASLEARKPQNSHCTEVQVPLARLLTNAYLFNDPVGYAVQIAQMLDYIEVDLEATGDYHSLVEWARACLKLALDDLDGALFHALRYQERARSDYRMAEVHSTLCGVSFRRGEYDQILRYAIAGDEHASRSPGTLYARLEFFAWQAFCARRSGDEIEGRRHVMMAHALQARLGEKPFIFYYDAICAYYEAGQQFAEALDQRTQQLSETLESRSPYAETECRLRRCVLLKRMGKPIAGEVQAAHTAAARLVKPDSFLARLEKALG